MYGAQESYVGLKTILKQVWDHADRIPTSEGFLHDQELAFISKPLHPHFGAPGIASRFPAQVMNMTQTSLRHESA